MDKIVFATSNINKLREAQSILKDLPYQVIGLDEFPNIPEIKETGKTLLDNSLIKARTVYNLIGLPSIGDDTGLEVEYLNGAPGVKSARYAGGNAAYKDNLNKLLKDLDGVPLGKRKAQFRTVISFVNALTEQWVEGIVEGIIIDKPRGSGGFGYDPIFYLPELKKTFAEIPMDEKNKISHRGLALEKFRILLGKFYLTK
ncbi:RdgB/HAM1 family non-canonical purine NTP pyrophosphatase [bacterium]|nr:RdgB/HAM1 family non-canonical purine NTP pyrophosphatase [bacterium]